jgi:uncharacterized Zn ribbon protein
MIPFSKECFCPKCRSKEVNKEHVSDDDSLNLKCEDCSYEWKMESFSARTKRMREHSSITSEFSDKYKNKEFGVI